MKAFVTGAAGFIGSNLVDRLLAEGHEVTGYDNFSSGQERFLDDALRSSAFDLVRGDLLDRDALTAAMAGCDIIFHLAANADVRFGLQHPGKDLEQNTVATFHVLEAMRANGVKRIAFSSTGSVYGEAEVIPTPESAPFPIQTSLYGASKLAGEGLIQAYCEGFGFEGYIFRFVSILGERYSHGHVFDFYRSLRSNPHELTVLGNGRQRKSYLYIQDCIDAILTALAHPTAKVHVYNLGVDEFVEVNDSIGWITRHLALEPKLSYTGGDRGWVGDNPFILLDCSKIRALGWTPKVSIAEGIIKTLDYLQANQWLLEARS
ncbi:MAG TPA: NAD-dependent epimerase/dehydratase family protein [Thermoanaerobaculia bacterium]|jgi:UDP-glucose 4-epimerase|nr:NAD-dependent epimerase/dehydratase family protein [Thermoanaerobaculia bacterium]